MEPGKVDPFAVHRNLACRAGVRAVEALLGDKTHLIARAAVEEFSLVPAQNVPSSTPNPLFCAGTETC